MRYFSTVMLICVLTTLIGVGQEGEEVGTAVPSVDIATYATTSDDSAAADKDAAAATQEEEDRAEIRDGQGTIELKFAAEREEDIVNDDGEDERVRVPVTTILPGEAVIYTIHYLNIGHENVLETVITNPIPKGMAYIPESVLGEGVEIRFSVDGGETFDIPKHLTVKGKDDKVYIAEAPDYTHIRWLIGSPLPPQGEGLLSFRAELNR